MSYVLVLLPVVLGAALLFFLLPKGDGAAADAPPDEDAPPGPAEPPLVRCVLRFGGELIVVDAAFTHARSEDGATLGFAIDDEEAGIVRIELDTRDGTGSLQIDGQRGVLFDEPELSMVTVQTGAGERRFPGIQAEFSFPLRGPVFRLRQVFLGFVDDPHTTRLVGELLRGAPEPDGVVPWTLDGATRFVRNQLEASLGSSEVTVTGPGELAYDHEGAEAQISIHNVFREVEVLPPEDGRALLERFVASMVTPPPPATGADQVTLRIYPGPTPFVFRMADGHTQAFASFELAEDLVAVFMQDTPQAMRSLQDHDLDALIPRDEALSIARRNVVREVGRIHLRGEGPLFMFIAGGNYEASLVAVPEVWEAIEDVLDGPPLVTIPARDLVFVTGDTGAERRAELKATCRDLHALSYAISDGVYRVHDRGERLERVL